MQCLSGFELYSRQVPLISQFPQASVKWEAFDVKINFYFYANKTFFNKKRFALGLISKVRVFGLWNWPIQL